MGSRTNRAHDARARAREARAVMLAERQAQDERIEDAVAAALLAIEDKAAALAEADQQERALAAALQRLGRERVGVGDIVTMTGLTETKVNRLVRMRVDHPVEVSDDDVVEDGDGPGEGPGLPGRGRPRRRARAPRPPACGTGRTSGEEASVPLADPAIQLLEAAVRDPAVVARYRGKVLEVPGSDCSWWHGAVSGRGHGRFYVGTVPARTAGDGGAGGDL